MKIKASSLSIIVLVCLYAFSGRAQQTHTITLYVDTEKVSIRNIEATCNFRQGPDISNENFTVYVKKGDTLIWKGVSTSSEDDKVDIKSIVYKSGTNFFDSTVLKDIGGVVTGVIVKGETDEYEKYDLYFKVYRNGRWLSTDFPIDPKLRFRR